MALAPAVAPLAAAPLAGLMRRETVSSFRAGTPLGAARLRGGLSMRATESRRSRHLVAAMGLEVEYDLEGEKIADDYYSILGVSPDASSDDIRKAYYGCMKVCHPDLSGDNPESTAFCMFINEVYEVLSDANMRAVYDEVIGYSTSGTNPFLDAHAERDHAFVDEYSCIGCKNCANTACNTFEMEMEFGRARVGRQDGDVPPLVQEAIDTCPVNCIHWVSAAQLSLLEDEMRRMERVNVATMLAGMGPKGMDVFSQAQWRWQKRQAKAAARAAAHLREAQQKKRKGQWGSFWEPATESPSEGEAAQEPASARPYNRGQMAKAAAAARRWREYSRRGIDRRATRFIGVAMEQAAEAQKMEEVPR